MTNAPAKRTKAKPALEMPAPPTDMRDRKRLNTQSRLYDCAVELFIEKGYENVAVEEICQRADVGRATFFRYFGSKAVLMGEFDRRVVAKIVARTASPSMSIHDQLIAVQAVIASAWSDVHPNLWALGRDYLSSTALTDLEVVAAGITDVTRIIFQRAMDSGQLRNEIPAELLASLFVTDLRIAVYRSIGRAGRPRMPQAPRMVVDLFLNGVAKA